MIRLLFWCILSPMFILNILFAALGKIFTALSYLIIGDIYNAKEEMTDWSVKMKL